MSPLDILIEPRASGIVLSERSAKAVRMSALVQMLWRRIHPDLGHGGGYVLPLVELICLLDR